MTEALEEVTRKYKKMLEENKRLKEKVASLEKEKNKLLVQLYGLYK